MIIQKHEYDGGIMHVGINNWTKNPNESKDITKKAADVIDVALQCQKYILYSIYFQCCV